MSRGGSGFNPGSNTLVLTIANTDNFLEGVRLQGSVEIAVPEPASLGLVVGTAGAVMAGGRRRRGRRCSH